jgi:hypothetical protein
MRGRSTIKPVSWPSGKGAACGPDAERLLAVNSVRGVLKQKLPEVDIAGAPYVFEPRGGVCG